MKENPYSADVPLEMGGKTWLLRYDWTALAAVRSEIGPDINKVITDADPAVLAAMLAIGLRRHHPEFTPVDGPGMVTAASPALGPAVAAIGRALDLAWNGPAAARAEVKANPPTRAAKIKAALARLVRLPTPSSAP